MSTTNHQPHPRSPSSTNRIYLLIYNTVCASLWLRILITTILILVSSSDVSDIYTSLEPWTRLTQTLAVAEIIHAACGRVSCFPPPKSILLTLYLRNHTLTCFYNLYSSFRSLNSGLGCQLCVPWNNFLLERLRSHATCVVNCGCHSVFIFCNHVSRFG